MERNESARSKILIQYEMYLESLVINIAWSHRREFAGRRDFPRCLTWQLFFRTCISLVLGFFVQTLGIEHSNPDAVTELTCPGPWSKSQQTPRTTGCHLCSCRTSGRVCWTSPVRSRVCPWEPRMPRRNSHSRPGQCRTAWRCQRWTPSWNDIA